MSDQAATLAKKKASEPFRSPHYALPGAAAPCEARLRRAVPSAAGSEGLYAS
jgi:hypothetical protein